MNLYPYDRTGQRLKTDIKSLAVNRCFIADYRIKAAFAVAQSVAGILAATALTNSIQDITENVYSPAVPRNITVVGNDASITGDVVITGTNYLGVTITETLALNGVTSVEGSKAFKTVTQVQLPVETNAGTDTVSVGFGNKLGLPYKLPRNTVLKTYLNNVLETTEPTVVINATTIENNTVELNSALNGTQVDIYLIV